jgi:RNA polymerase sigma-70 factor (ECF subfamily)
MRDVTDIGGAGAGFPSTLWTAVLAARDRSTRDYAERLERLVQLYWKPVYWVIRRQWGKPNEEAKDLTQDFFASFLEKDRLKDVGPEKGRFRTYLRTVLMNYLRNRAEAEHALKRGGRARVFSMNATDDELPITAAASEPGEFLDRAWALSILRGAQTELAEHYRRAGREVYATVFPRRDLALSPPTYAELAQELKITIHDIENYLKHARATFSRLLRARVRETLAADGEVDDELRYLSQVLRRQVQDPGCS